MIEIKEVDRGYYGSRDGKAVARHSYRRYKVIDDEIVFEISLDRNLATGYFALSSLATPVDEGRYFNVVRGRSARYAWGKRLTWTMAEKLAFDAIQEYFQPVTVS